MAASNAARTSGSGSVDRLLARSRVALVFWDPETQRSTEPPQDLRELLSRTS